MLLTQRIGKWTYCVSNFRGFRPKHWKLERKKSHSCHTLLDPKHWNACHYTARVRDSVFFITPYNACPTCSGLLLVQWLTGHIYNSIVTANWRRAGEVNVKICGIHCYSNTKKYMTYMDSMYTSGLWTAGMIQANECLGAISTCLPRCTALWRDALHPCKHQIILFRFSHFQKLVMETWSSELDPVSL